MKDEEMQCLCCYNPPHSTMPLPECLRHIKRHTDFFLEMNLEAHLGRELEGSPLGVQEYLLSSTCCGGAVFCGHKCL